MSGAQTMYVTTTLAHCMNAQLLHAAKLHHSNWLSCELLFMQSEHNMSTNILKTTIMILLLLFTIYIMLHTPNAKDSAIKCNFGREGCLKSIFHMYIKYQHPCFGLPFWLLSVLQTHFIYSANTIFIHSSWPATHSSYTQPTSSRFLYFAAFCPNLHFHLVALLLPE